MPARSGRIARVALGVLAVGYPVLVYVGLTRWSARAVGVAVVAVMVPVLVLRAREVGAARLGQAALPIAPAVLLGGAAAAVGSSAFLLWVPVVVSLLLLASFGSSLRRGATPVVERIARLSEPDLPPPGIRHCRQVTIAWCLFFVANAAVAAGLAMWAPFAWWALYTGGIAYGLMGLMFAGELVVRRLRMPGVAS